MNSYMKTLIVPSCYTANLNNLPVDLENLILIRVYVNDNNYKLQNLPIALKTLIIGTVIGPTQSEIDFMASIKLPFGCKIIFGIMTSCINRRIFSFKYINNCHEFDYETAIASDVLNTTPHRIFKYSSDLYCFYY